jgi:hypothetical protein
MYFSRWSLVLISFQYRQKTLMDTDILLFCLYHPDALLTHRPYYAKNVHMICNLNLLQNSIQGNKCTRTTHTSTVNITKCDSNLHSSDHNALWEDTFRIISQTFRWKCIWFISSGISKALILLDSLQEPQKVLISFTTVVTALLTHSHTIIIQGVSRLYVITVGGDFLGLSDEKSSYKHVSDFGRLQSYGRF